MTTACDGSTNVAKKDALWEDARAIVMVCVCDAYGRVWEGLGPPETKIGVDDLVFHVEAKKYTENTREKVIVAKRTDCIDTT